MDVEQLIDDTIDPELQAWLRKWPGAVEALNHVRDLFVGLKKTTIVGEIDEHVSISGLVHVGKGSKIHPFVTIQGPVIIGENVSVKS